MSHVQSSFQNQLIFAQVEKNGRGANSFGMPISRDVQDYLCVSYPDYYSKICTRMPVPNWYMGNVVELFTDGDME